MKVAFLTLGCKVNFYETEKMEADFEANHVTVVPFKEKADVYIVNTCTVTILQTENPARCFTVPDV